MFTTNYNLTSEGAQLPRFWFLEEHSIESLKHYMPIFHDLSVQKRLGNDHPKSGVCELVFCLRAKCCRFKVNTETWLPTKDGLFDFKIGVWNQWERRGKVRRKLRHLFSCLVTQIRTGESFPKYPDWTATQLLLLYFILWVWTVWFSLINFGLISVWICMS